MTIHTEGLAQKEFELKHQEIKSISNTLDADIGLMLYEKVRFPLSSNEKIIETIFLEEYEHETESIRPRNGEVSLGKEGGTKKAYRGNCPRPKAVDP